MTIFFDTEAYVEKDTNRHICYCVCYQWGKKQNSFYGEDCVIKFLNEITNTDFEKFILISHNVSYDICFIIHAMDVIYNNSIIKKNQVLKLVGMYHSKKLIFKDSYAIIPRALRDFGKMFDLPVEKELFPYRYYDIQLNKGEYIRGSIEDASWFFTGSDKNEFIRRVKTGSDNKYDPDKKFFNMKKYCEYYCMRDVEVLKLGYEKFRDFISKEFGIDILAYVSISSIANEIMCRKVYYLNGNLYDLSGTPRNFISKCVHGGRCLFKKEIVNEDVICLDANSLYPSAMKRLYCLEGMPMVLDKHQLTQKYLNFHLFEDDQEIPNIEKFISGFFIQVEIVKFRQREFPILPDLKPGAIIFIDHITFQDLIKYCNMKMKIIRGFYYSGYRDFKIRTVIQELYSLRQKNKNTPIENIVKIILNSIYGKTIITPINYDTKFVKNENLEKYLYRHFNNITMADTILNSNYTKIKEKKLIDKHRNFVPLGCNILSMSKRIMNEVFCLAEDYHIPIYYTDTDSLYMKLEDLPRLEELYMKMFNRVLYGNDLEQFKKDFPQTCKKSIFVGKKAYCNYLDDGTYHYRLKGIPQDCISKKADSLKISILELYERLFNGEEILFDLCDSEKPKITTKNFNAITKQSFIRNIKF